jgi:hypothetical protein
METIQEVRRQQQLRTLEQRRLEHTKEMTRQRLHSRSAHGAQSGDKLGHLSFEAATEGSPNRRND